jgi:hypothetical protein
MGGADLQLQRPFGLGAQGAGVHASQWVCCSMPARSTAGSYAGCAINKKIVF